MHARTHAHAHISTRRRHTMTQQKHPPTTPPTTLPHPRGLYLEVVSRPHECPLATEMPSRAGAAPATGQYFFFIFFLFCSSCDRTIHACVCIYVCVYIYVCVCTYVCVGVYRYNTCELTCVPLKESNKQRLA